MGSLIEMPVLVGLVYVALWARRKFYPSLSTREWDNGFGRRMAASLEARVGTKDKGGKSTKKPAAKNLKQKRQDKKTKKVSLGLKQSKVV